MGHYKDRLGYHLHAPKSVPLKGQTLYGSQWFHFLYPQGNRSYMVWIDKGTADGHGDEVLLSSASSDRRCSGAATVSKLRLIPPFMAGKCQCWLLC